MFPNLSRISFFSVMIILAVAGFGNVASSDELEGNWRNMRRAGVNAVYLSFDANGCFYLESRSSWYQGCYRIDTNGDFSQLILDVEAGSEIENIGKQFAYSYALDDETLILAESQSSGILESQGFKERSVYVAINHDSDEDDDDDEFTLYASCFIETAL